MHVFLSYVKNEKLRLQRVLQLFILNMRGLIPDPSKTLIGKSDFRNIDSKIRVADSVTLVLEIKNDSKVYVNTTILTLTPVPSIFAQIGELDQKKISWENGLLETANGIQNRQDRLQEVQKTTNNAIRFDYGTIDETHYSRVYRFYIDDEKTPIFFAYQYANNGKIVIYQNLKQNTVRLLSSYPVIGAIDGELQLRLPRLHRREYDQHCLLFVRLRGDQEFGCLPSEWAFCAKERTGREYSYNLRWNLLTNLSFSRTSLATLVLILGMMGARNGRCRRWGLFGTKQGSALSSISSGI